MATRTKTWGEFTRWCDSRGLKAFPAHPWTIAAYLRWVDRRSDAKTAREALNVISREHLLKSARVPGRYPTVQRTIELIERRAETRGLHSNLFDEDIPPHDVSATVGAPEDPSRDENPEETDDGEGESLPKRRALASTPRLVRRRKP